MVLLEVFEANESLPATVVIGIRVNETLVSNDGYAFVELSEDQAGDLAAIILEKLEGF